MENFGSFNFESIQFSGKHGVWNYTIFGGPWNFFQRKEEGRAGAVKSEKRQERGKREKAEERTKKRQRRETKEGIGKREKG